MATSEDEEFEKVAQVHSENVQQAEERMQQASAHFHSEEARQLYAQFQESFALWKEKSGNVFKLVKDNKLRFARKASDYGSALETFATMRELIDLLQRMGYFFVFHLLHG